MSIEENKIERLAQLELEAQRERALQSVTASLSSAATRAEILRAFLDEGGRVIASSAGVAYLRSGDGRSLVLVAHRGISDALVKTLTGLSVDSAYPVARSIRDGQPVWESDREALDRDFPDLERAVGDAVERQALFALPLRFRGDVVAGIGFAFSDTHKFDPGERAFLTTLGQRCEAAMERASLYEESQQARAAAEQSRAAAEALLRFNEIVSGILAHDLKNPLAAVLMNARMLRDAEAERTRVVGARIVRSGERMSRMIDQVLEWTRLGAEGGHVRLACAECDLGAISDEVLAELRTRDAEAPISLEARGDLRGHWDSDRLAQVVSNLVGNALDHASRPGASLSLNGEGPEVRIAVQNEGRIDDEIFPVLFEPFRGRTSGSRARGRGLGLGLYITREIVDAHGGRIEVERAPPSRVTFVVTLPRARP
jgi:signal transduction histidine kinase